jgi:3-isopropylmalate dehydratase small subunit
MAKKTAIKKVAQAEIRAAKSFLERRNIDSDEVSPKKFAKAAKELDKSFNETLKILARELTGGQV